MTSPAFLSETRERFLKAILAELPLDRVREVYLFSPIRQGGVESGVAVVAGYTEPAAEASVGDEVANRGEAEVAASGEAEVAASGAGEGNEPTCEALPAEDVAPADEPRTAPAEKYTVYSARYRHVLKGPDRGKWEASLVAEAEAPLLSIESVVRGVQRRSGDVESPDHMTADDIRAALRLGPAPTSDAA